jgi:hypothetical protein
LSGLRSSAYTFSSTCSARWPAAQRTQPRWYVRCAAREGVPRCLQRRSSQAWCSGSRRCPPSITGLSRETITVIATQELRRRLPKRVRRGTRRRNRLAVRVRQRARRGERLELDSEASRRRVAVLVVALILSGATAHYGAAVPAVQRNGLIVGEVGVCNIPGHSQTRPSRSRQSIATGDVLQQRRPAVRPTATAFASPRDALADRDLDGLRATGTTTALANQP